MDSETVLALVVEYLHAQGYYHAEAALRDELDQALAKGKGRRKKKGKALLEVLLKQAYDKELEDVENVVAGKKKGDAKPGGPLPSDGDSKVPPAVPRPPSTASNPMTADKSERSTGSRASGSIKVRSAKKGAPKPPPQTAEEWTNDDDLGYYSAPVNASPGPFSRDFINDHATYWDDGPSGCYDPDMVAKEKKEEQSIPLKLKGKDPTSKPPVSKVEASGTGTEKKVVLKHLPDSTGKEDIYPLEHESKIWDQMQMKVLYQRHHTGFEDTKDFVIRLGDIVAGRYQIAEYLGSAAFSKAVQCLDMVTNNMVCIKIIKNNKDFFDQSLDEIKLLKLINAIADPDEKRVVKLFDYFYFKEHLFIVCELLRDNLYEFSKFNRDSGQPAYFTLPRLQRITKQCLEALEYIHNLGLVHCDLKPENILIESYSRCKVKIIDFGSSCFTTDHLSSYVQSRSYRAPEVILGLPYTSKIDMWSMGCIIAELWSGQVLFLNDSVQTLMARMIGIVGPIPKSMLDAARYTMKYFTDSYILFDKARTGREVDDNNGGPSNPPPASVGTMDPKNYVYLYPKKSSLKKRLHSDDDEFLDFLAYLLRINPLERPSAREALKHPWLKKEYADDSGPAFK